MRLGKEQSTGFAHNPDDPGAIALLGAEVALLRARLDEMERGLNRLATGVARPGTRRRPFAPPYTAASPG
jgi:hypothetical protein